MKKIVLAVAFLAGAVGLTSSASAAFQPMCRDNVTDANVTINAKICNIESWIAGQSSDPLNYTSQINQQNQNIQGLSIQVTKLYDKVATDEATINQLRIEVDRLNQRAFPATTPTTTSTNSQLENRVYKIESSITALQNQVITILNMTVKIFTSLKLK
jgi:uncharacterized coiled-coil protein SlyX